MNAELQGLKNIAEGMHQAALKRIAEYERTHCRNCHRAWQGWRPDSEHAVCCGASRVRILPR